MKTKTLLTIVAASALCGLTTPVGHAQDIDSFAPVVVKAVPEAGSKEVSPGVYEVKITFSKEMADQSWSWCSVWQNSDPESLGKPHYEADHKTCVMKVKLEPGKTYGWWINSQKFHGFQDTQGHAAIPYLLTFKIQSASRLPTDDQLATKVSLTKPYPLSYEGAETDKISVQYAVIELAKQAKLGYDWAASQANAGEVCRKYITPTIEGIPLREALDKILQPEALTYDIQDGEIVLKKI